MCARGLTRVVARYNAVNGVPSCANAAFQNGVLREKWGWDGFIGENAAGSHPHAVRPRLLRPASPLAPGRALAVQSDA